MYRGGAGADADQETDDRGYGKTLAWECDHAGGGGETDRGEAGRGKARNRGGETHGAAGGQVGNLP